ncbi:hypothetical protein, partial [Rhodovulum sp.]|uniref:hypothetical protein n=1 Tax=Rhodovulum sp. TaxID=34009 RepID=UPI00257D3682
MDRKTGGGCSRNCFQALAGRAWTGPRPFDAVKKTRPGVRGYLSEARLSIDFVHANDPPAQAAGANRE